LIIKFGDDFLGRIAILSSSEDGRSKKAPYTYISGIYYAG